MPSQDWIEDCQRWRGRLLTGKLGHWCYDWDGLPVDETCDEFAACMCWEEDEVLKRTGKTKKAFDEETYERWERDAPKQTQETELEEV